MILDKTASSVADEFPLTIGTTPLLVGEASAGAVLGAEAVAPAPDPNVILAQPVILENNLPAAHNAAIAASTVSEFIRPTRSGEKASVSSAATAVSDMDLPQNQLADRKGGIDTHTDHNGGIDTKYASEAPRTVNLFARETPVEPRLIPIGETLAPAMVEFPRIAVGETAPIGQFESAAHGAMLSTSVPVIRELELKAHPASPVWREAFSAQVSVLIGERVQSAEKRVNPPELGPVEIRIFTVDQHTSIVFTAAHEETRRAIEDALPRLREVLQESGVNLDSTTVNRERSSGDSHREGHGNAGRAASETDDKAEDPQANMASPRRSEGLIDTFA